ncbi:MAG TPA: hypothetical protein ENI81_08230 [Phycisphaerales bacterium]|nr:hypothetical protein [Phycisphaerales bacterium]
MKDIDFLPEWYKSGRRREVGYRTQYMALGGIFLVMAVWSLTASRSISKAQAEFADMAAMHTKAESTSKDLAVLKNELADLQKKFESMEEIDSKIDVASVLAEMSFLIEQEIVLGKVEFIAEKFATEEKDETSTRSGTLVRAVRVRSRQGQQPPLGNVRFKVVISGVAANTGDVATLISKFEESPYFFQVVPSFSRSAELEVENSASPEARDRVVKRTSETGNSIVDARKDLQVSEFEISCYLANYRKL